MGRFHLHHPRFVGRQTSRNGYHGAGVEERLSEYHRCVRKILLRRIPRRPVPLDNGSSYNGPRRVWIWPLMPFLFYKYKNSDSGHSSDGIQSGTPDIYDCTELKLPYRWSDETLWRIRLTKDEDQWLEGEQPIYKRAGALQAPLLSPRVLFYAYDRLVFRCQNTYVTNGTFRSLTAGLKSWNHTRCVT